MAHRQRCADSLQVVTPSAEGLGLELEVVWNSSVLHHNSNSVLHHNASLGVVVVFVFWVNDDVISDAGVFVDYSISYSTVGPNAVVRHFSRCAHAISLDVASHHYDVL